MHPSVLASRRWLTFSSNVETRDAKHFSVTFRRTRAHSGRNASQHLCPTVSRTWPEITTHHFKNRSVPRVAERAMDTVVDTLKK